MKKNKLCFVCTGNTCRSPMALFILKNKLLNHPEIELTVSSYGIKVVEESIKWRTLYFLMESPVFQIDSPDLSESQHTAKYCVG